MCGVSFVFPSHSMNLPRYCNNATQQLDVVRQGHDLEMLICFPISGFLLTQATFSSCLVGFAVIGESGQEDILFNLAR